MKIMNKEQFLKIMHRMQTCWEADLEINMILRKRNIEFGESNASELMNELIEVLAFIFDDVDTIEYFVFGLDFGKTWKPGCITETDEDGNVVDIDLSSMDKLYDLLVKEMKE